MDINKKYIKNFIKILKDRRLKAKMLYKECLKENKLGDNDEAWMWVHRSFGRMETTEYIIDDFKKYFNIK